MNQNTQETQPTDIIGAIIAYELGELEGNAITQLFCDLFNRGMLSQLQGSYGRAWQSLYDGGAIYIDPKSGVASPADIEED